MILALLACCLSVFVAGQQANDEWVDPYDMINYDANAKTMRKPAQPSSYDHVNTKRREHIQEDPKIEDQKEKNGVISQEPTFNPVFKRFLSQLLKEIKRVGAPGDFSEVIYNAKIKLSKQAVTEIQSFVEGKDYGRTGALDNAISQMLVELKLHNHVAVLWHFEDTFGVELDTVIKIGFFILINVAIICTPLWSIVSWFMFFRRFFAVSFFVSIIWNWFYLYKIAFAEHQNNLVKMDNFNEKCTGVKKIDWSDSLREWFRSTWTLQDDPCQNYYEVLMVNPILLVPPTKAISLTITTFFTEPLKHVGQGISEFLRALLKDLPITLQIPVLIVIMIAIVVCVYGSVQATFQHGIMAPLRGPRRDQPPPQIVQQPPQQFGIEYQHNLGEDNGQAPPPVRAYPIEQLHAPQPNTMAENGHLTKNQMRPHLAAPKVEPASIVVETLRNAADETDTKPIVKKLKEVDVPTVAELEKQSDTEQLSEAGGVSAQTIKTKVNESDTSKSKEKTEAELPKDGAKTELQQAERQQTQTKVQQLGASNKEVENVGVTVEETSSEP